MTKYRAWWIENAEKLILYHSDDFEEIAKWLNGQKLNAGYPIFDSPLIGGLFVWNEEFSVWKTYQNDYGNNVWEEIKPYPEEYNA